MPRFCPLPVILALYTAFSAQAEEGLGSSTILADQVDGQGTATVRAQGNVQIDRDGRRVEADWMTLFQDTRELRAGDHTRLTEDRNVVEGGLFHLRESDRTGEMSTPSFRFGNGKRPGRGDAWKLLFEGPGKYRLQKARFTTCSVGEDDWFLKADQLKLDYNRNLGVARSGTIEFKGVPILYSPYIDFSLDGSRKSGLLAPSFKYTGAGGLDLSLPFYWNIAPNMDATIAPRFIAKRGVLFNNEFRYLGERFSGELHGEVIDKDRNFGGDRRYAISYQHQHQLADGLVGELDLQRASDDRYFVDFGDRLAVASQTFLPRQGLLSYAVPGLNMQLLVQRYQTLQDVSNPVIQPYARLPQLNFNYSPALPTPYRFDLSGEATVFKYGTQLDSSLANTRSTLDGRRSILYPSVSLPLERNWGFITPRIGAHLSRYVLGDGRKLKRNLPVFSVDSGMYFDRETKWFGSDMTQSLEPRAYYVRIPYRDQSAFPNFDSGLADFNFAQMFSENQYTGGDRVNDANQLTMALTSRLFERETGVERARVAIGQRFYFDSQRVTLNETARGHDVTTSDLIATVGGRPHDDWWLDASWQYDQQTRVTRKSALNLRYQPLPGSSLNLGYRVDKRYDIKQADISTQWPLTRKIHAIARYNWSISDGRTLESLAGLEYNGGCWVFRAVNQRFVTPANETRDMFFLQLELNDLGPIGSNPLQTLKNSIPGYTKLN
ncbi:LPS-assembly protein LptD [Chitinimonas sp. BJB300]|uniref:LPS-assembly protein LptD n=1 Tax=Chitinimonas sp. BJB300 TaxID=1559339 RepID=UPI0013041775|nr:LPS-assembly protein LptD [Chitinimonas sp. BJB300]